MWLKDQSNFGQRTLSDSYSEGAIYNEIDSDPIFMFFNKFSLKLRADFSNFPATGFLI